MVQPTLDSPARSSLGGASGAVRGRLQACYSCLAVPSVMLQHIALGAYGNAPFPFSSSLPRSSNAICSLSAGADSQNDRLYFLWNYPRLPIHALDQLIGFRIVDKRFRIAVEAECPVADAIGNVAQMTERRG